MEIKEVFKEWSEKLNIPVEEFEKEYTDWYNKLKKDRSELTEEQLKIKSLSYLRGTHSRQFQSSAKIFSCYVLGFGSGYDPFKKERDAAINGGFINEDGKPIFFNEAPNLSWRKNQPIPHADADESFQRILYGIFKVQGTDEFKPGLFYLAGRKVNSNMPVLFTEYKVRAGCKAEILNGPILTLNTAGVTRFEKVGNGTTDFEKMSQALLPNNIVDLAKIEEFDANQAPLGLYITKGSVININNTKEGIRSNAVDVAVIAKDLSDVSEIDEKGGTNITFWVSKDQPLDFAVGSEVMVVGSKYTSTKNGEATTGYNAVGIYVTYNAAPEEKPAEITAENTQATEEPVKEEEKVEPVKEEKEEPVKEEKAEPPAETPKTEEAPKAEAPSESLRPESKPPTESGGKQW